jgi:hypothetical protein
MRDTFNPAYSNLNVHLKQEAYDEFKRDWPESRPFGLHEDSLHSPVFVAMKDVVSSESERWRLIESCDINRNWSAMIGVFRGQLRAWFCEIAGAQSILHQSNPDYPDTGVPVTPGWWRRPMSDFTGQVLKHCHECGIPLRGKARKSQGLDADVCSPIHQSVCQPKSSNAKVEVVGRIGIGETATVTEYYKGRR